MTTKEIKDELSKIYKERKSWNGAKGPFDAVSVRRRELILIKQHLLYRIEDAKLLGDKNEEHFNLVLYKVISDYLNYIDMVKLHSKGG